MLVVRDGRVAEFMVEQRAPLRVGRVVVGPEEFAQENHEVIRRELAIEVTGLFAFADGDLAVDVGLPGRAPGQRDARAIDLVVVLVHELVQQVVHPPAAFGFGIDEAVRQFLRTLRRHGYPFDGRR
jgi:hypothetical protein